MSWENRHRRHREMQKRKAKIRDFNKCAIQDLCDEMGYTAVHFTEYHIRINGKLDIYPTSKRYCLPKLGERGDIINLDEDVPRLLAK